MNSELSRVIAGTLGIDVQDVHPELSRENCENWDSLKHLRLITAIEESFGSKLTMTQIAEINNVADLEEALGSCAEAGK